MTNFFTATKSITTGKGIIWVLLLFILASTSFKTEPRHPRPFRGTIYTTVDVLDGEEPILLYHVTGVGTLTHLGKTRFESETTIDLSADPDQVTGSPTFTAANGDQLYTTFTGTATPIDENTSIIERHFEITGGTGRFADATGQFTGTSISPLAGSGTPEPSSIIIEGTISY
jgi:hypothetical protein